jgi:SAM-dependent methyltransferase
VSATNANFGGKLPANYDHYLGPVLFDPFAADLASRAGGLAAAGLEDILEIGCGTGILTRHLLAKLPAATRIVATDLSEDMLAFARGKFGSSERIQWRQADAMKLPFADASFDLVVCQFVWMFMPDKSDHARKVRRVLRSGGSFLFNVWDSLAQNDLARITQTVLDESFPDDPPQFFQVAFGCHQRDTLKAALKNGGFPDVRIEVVPKRCEAASALQVATGLITGLPLGKMIAERRSIDESAMIELIASRLAENFGDPPTTARLLGLVVTARA